MPNPIKKLLDRCQVGFPLWQKWAITAGILLYCISPLDAIPDIFPFIGWFDDGFALYLLFRVWASPTLIQVFGEPPASLHPAGGKTDASVIVDEHSAEGQPR